MLFNFISDAKDSVMAKMSDMRFEHHYNNVMNDKIPKKSSSASTTKDTYKPATPVKQEETKKPEEKEKTVEKKSETEEKNKETYEALEKMMIDFEAKTADLDGVMEDGLKDIVEAVKRFKENKAKTMANSNVPAVSTSEPDPADGEHPTDEDESGNEPKEPEKRIIDLKVLDSKHILDVVYTTCLENAEQLLKYTVADDENLSKEERAKVDEEFDKILLPNIAKNLTGLQDVSNIDMKQLEKDLNDKVGAGALSSSIKSAFTVYTNGNIPDGKPLDLTKNVPMEIVEESPVESSPAEPEPSQNNSGTRRSNRRKK